MPASLGRKKISISCSESTNAPLMLHNSDVAVAISYSRSWACLQAKVMAHACMCAHALGSWAYDLDIQKANLQSVRLSALLSCGRRCTFWAVAPGAMAAAHLEDVSTDDLIKEVQRRIECATRPEKHVVLIGNLAELELHQCLVCSLLRPSLRHLMRRSVMCI
jgi:hypothetical protein